MRVLVDTNVFLEVLLDQQRALEAKRFLDAPPDRLLCISDFSLHSIGVLLVRRNQGEVFRTFVADMILGAGLEVVGIVAETIGDVVDAAERYNLDFDDAYQVVVARQRGLVVVSYDADFDRTPQGRLDPRTAHNPPPEDVEP